MADDRMAVLRGTLDVLVLKSLSFGPRHGYGVAEWLEQVSGELLRLEEGSLYPALHRLERRGLVAATWGLSGNNRRAKYYQLTPAGRRRLRAETAWWEQFAGMVSAVLATPVEVTQ